MAAPSFVGAGTGALWASGGAVAVTKTGCTTGNLVFLHILNDGTTSGAPTLSSISGVANLAGTANAWTEVAVNQDVGSSSAFHHLYVGRATGSTVSTSMANASGNDLYGRVYEFQNASAGTTLENVLESIANGTGTTSAVADTGVTTTGKDRLACQFVAINDDNAMGAFTGMSGGTWAEAVAEYATATGTDGCIQLQTATIASAGTINGGSYTMAAADPWGVIGLAILPTSYEQAVTVPLITSTAAAYAPSSITNRNVDMALPLVMAGGSGDTTVTWETFSTVWTYTQWGGITLTESVGSYLNLNGGIGSILDNEGRWTTPGETWESLFGVDPGSTVTHAKLDGLGMTVTIPDAATPYALLGEVYLILGGTQWVRLYAGRYETGDVSDLSEWTVPPQSAVAIPAAYQASDTSVSIEIRHSIGNSMALQSIDITYDNLDITLTGQGGAVAYPMTIEEAAGPAGFTMPLIDAAAAIYAPTLTPKYALTLPLVESAPALHEPTLTAGPLTMTVPLINATGTLYAPTLTPAPYPVTLPFLESSPDAFAPTLVHRFPMALPLVDSGAAIYAPELAHKASLALPLVDAGAAIYAPTIASVRTISNLDLLDAIAIDQYGPVVAQDSFTDTAGTDLTAHTPDVGGTWNVSVTGKIKINAAGEAEVTSIPPDESGEVVAWQSATLRDGSVRCMQYGNNIGKGGPIVRYQPGQNCWYGIRYAQLYRVTNGVFTVLANLGGGYSEWRLTAVGTNPTRLTATRFYEGEDYGSWYVEDSTAANQTTEGKPGFGVYYDYYDDPASTIIENWIARDLSQLFPPVLAAGPANLTLPLAGDDPATYAPTLTPAPWLLTLPQAGSDPAIYAPTLLPKYALTLPLVESTPDLYPPTVRGIRTMVLPLADSTPAAYAPKLSLVLAVPLIDAGSAAYAPSLAPAPYPMTLPLVDAGSAIYEPSITGAGNLLTLPLLESTPAAHAPAVTPAPYPVTLPLAGGDPAIYAPTITAGGYSLELPVVESLPAAYAPTLTAKYLLDLPLASSDPAIFTPVLVPIWAVTLPLVQSTAEAYPPTVLPGSYQLAMPLVDAGADIFSPTLVPASVTLELPVADSTPATYPPTIEGIATQRLDLPLVESTPGLWAPAITKASVVIAGVTRNQYGAPIGGCVVDVFRSSDNAFITTTTSDGSGRYSVLVSGGAQYFLVAYHTAGRVAGVTLRDVEGE